MTSQPTDQNTLKYALRLALGATCISTAPVFVKMCFAEGLGPTTIGIWRLWIAALVFLGLALSIGGSIKVRAGLKWALLAGASFACDLYVWHKSIFFVGAGMATILGNMQVFPTSVLGRILYKERLSTVFKISVPLALIGVTLLVGIGEINISGNYALGVFFGLATAVFYSGYVISLKNATREQAKLDPANPSRLFETMALLGWVAVSSALLLSGAGAIEGEAIFNVSANGWIYCAALALIAQVLGWLLIYTSLSKLPASRSALILLLQPTFATLWGAIFFGESLTALQLTGAGITLAAVYLGNRRS